MQKRLVLLFGFFVLFMGVFSMRLITLNLNEDLSAAAVQQTSKRILLGESRGTIYDCHQKPFVNEQKEKTLCVLLSDMGLEKAKTILSKEVFQNIDTKKVPILKVPLETNISEAELKSTDVIKRYQVNNLAAHLIGYVNEEGNGVAGLEKIYDSYLKESGGKLFALCTVNAKGHLLKGRPLTFENQNYDTKAGLELTLDKDLQKITEQALDAFAIEKGAAVLLDAKTAEIRAMVSRPVFSQNAPEKSLQNPNAPFLNRAILPYSVGSVFKTVVAAAALEKGIPETFSANCLGKEMIGKTAFHCHHHSGHGLQTMPEAMANSCNPYFIQLFQKTGKDSVLSMAENLGLGAPIELADGFYTKAGHLPSNEELKSRQDEANLAFGQGTLLASPLQLSALYAAFANDGIYRAPSLIQSKVNANGEIFAKTFLPVPRRTMSKETAKHIQNILKYTVNTGSCRRAKPDRAEACGKSGTAQSGWHATQGREINHAWFCGWFPADNPQYVLTVFKEDGAGGSTDCAPIFKAIADCILETESTEK